MTVLVLGAKGMLGTDLVAELQKREIEHTALDIDDLDITDPTAVARLTTGEFGRFDWWINCAAYTAVDKAETEQDAAFLVNGLAPGYLAQASQAANARLLHVSTDFVFDGEAKTPYREDAPTNPLGVYGKSKLQGEQSVLSVPSHLVVRTSWLFGPNGASFPKTMIRAWLAGKGLRVVSDQVGTPTYTADLARVLADLIHRKPQGGIYHAAGPDIVTWHEVAAQALASYRDEVLRTNAPIQVEKIATADWPTPAKRPKYSALSFEKCAALGVHPMRPLAVTMEEFARRLKLES